MAIGLREQFATFLEGVKSSFRGRFNKRSEKEGGSKEPSTEAKKTAEKSVDKTDLGGIRLGPIKVWFIRIFFSLFCGIVAALLFDWFLVWLGADILSFWMVVGLSLLFGLVIGVSDDGGTVVPVNHAAVVTWLGFPT